MEFTEQNVDRDSSRQSEIMTTCEKIFEFQGCPSLIHLNKLLDEFQLDDRSRSEETGPILRTRLITDDEQYMVYADVLTSLEEREMGKETVIPNQLIGYFEIKRGVLIGVALITAKWAKGYFEKFYEYINLYGIPETNKLFFEAARGKSGRPHFEEDIEAWNQLHIDKKDPSIVYKEWLKKVSYRNLFNPERQFKRISKVKWRTKS